MDVSLVCLGSKIAFLCKDTTFPVLLFRIPLHTIGLVITLHGGPNYPIYRESMVNNNHRIFLEGEKH